MQPVDTFLQQLQGVPPLQLHGGGHLPGSTLLGSLAEWVAQTHQTRPGHAKTSCVLFIEGADTMSASVLSGVLRLLREHRGLKGGKVSGSVHLPVSVVFSIAAPVEVFHSRLHRAAAQCVRIHNVHLLNPLVTLDVLLHTALVRGVLPLTPPPRAVRWALSHALAWNLSLTSMVQRLSVYNVLLACSISVFSLSGPLPQPVFRPVHSVLTEQLLHSVLAGTTKSAPTAPSPLSLSRLVSVLEQQESPTAEHTAVQSLFLPAPPMPGAVASAVGASLPGEVTSNLWFSAVQRAAAVPADVFQDVLDSSEWQAYKLARGQQWDEDGVPSAEITACAALAALAEHWLAAGVAQDAQQAAKATTGSSPGAAQAKNKSKGARNTAPQPERGIRRVLSDFMLAPDAPSLSIAQTPALWPPGFVQGIDSTTAVLTPCREWMALPTSAVCADAATIENRKQSPSGGASSPPVPARSPQGRTRRRGTPSPLRASIKAMHGRDHNDSDRSDDAVSLDEEGTKRAEVQVDVAWGVAATAVVSHNSDEMCSVQAPFPLVWSNAPPKWWLRGDRRRLAQALYTLAVSRIARHRVFRVIAHISALREKGFAANSNETAEQWLKAFPAPTASCTSERRMFVEVTTSATPVVATSWFANMKDSLRVLPWEGLSAFVLHVLQVLVTGRGSDSISAGSASEGFLLREDLCTLDASCAWPAAFATEIASGVQLRAQLARLREEPAADDTKAAPPQDIATRTTAASKPAVRFASSSHRRAAALKSAASAAATPLSRARDAIWGWLAMVVQRWCVPTTDLPLGSLFFGTSETQMKRTLAPRLRESTLEALESPDLYLIDIAPPAAVAEGGGGATASTAARSLLRVDPLAPDAARAFAIYKRAAKRISLAEWLGAFLASFGSEARPGGGGLDVGSFVAGAAKGRRVAGQRRGGDAGKKPAAGGPRRRGVKRSRVGTRAEHEVAPGSPPAHPSSAHPLTSPDPTARSDSEDDLADEDQPEQVDLEGAKCRFIAAVRQLGMLGLLRKAGAGKDDSIQKLVFDTVAW